ncbi:MAG: glutathione S-transferase, partial [Betaproteobacteria bacterium]|nr:glutathione S-transferase [Betaproteobacteria bacterium]
GDTFSLADCTAVAHLPLISTATKIIYGQDFLSELPVKEYLRHLSTRATVTQVNADRKVSAEKMVARRQASQG